MNRNPSLPTPGEAEGDRATADADLREEEARGGAGRDAATPARKDQGAGTDRSAGNPDSGAALPTPGSAEGRR
jgi:hypothetical protein